MKLEGDAWIVSETSELWATCQGKPHTGCGTSPGEGSVLPSTEGQSYLSPLTLNMELQYLQSPLLVFCLNLVQYFLTMSPFLPLEW